MKMNNTKRVIKALNKLEYAIVTRNRLSKFMQNITFHGFIIVEMKPTIIQG